MKLNDNNNKIGNAEQEAALKDADECPFCGDDFLYFMNGDKQVSCDNCGASGPVVDKADGTHAEAVTMWNDRTYE